MVKFNCHPRASKRGHPVWANNIIEDARIAFMQEYNISKSDVDDYIVGDHARRNTDRSAKLKEIVDLYIGINVEVYEKVGVPSWGVIIDESDPIVVEYKLRYANTNDED